MSSDDAIWHFVDGAGEECGPCTAKALATLVVAGHVAESSLVRNEQDGGRDNSRDRGGHWGHAWSTFGYMEVALDHFRITWRSL